MQFFKVRPAKRKKKFSKGEKRKFLQSNEDAKAKSKNKSKIRKNDDEEIESDDEIENQIADTVIEKEVDDKSSPLYENQQEEEEVDEFEQETAQEKRVRLAQQYIDELKKQREEEEDNEISKLPTIQQQLRDEIQETKGQLQRYLADNYTDVDADKAVMRKCKHHQKTLTCIAVTSNGIIFTASKDCTIVKWNLKGQILGHIPRGKKPDKPLIESRAQAKTSDDPIFAGHRTCILSLAVSTDSKFLASGDMSGHILVWNASDLSFLHLLYKHKGMPVSALSFRKGTPTLYSAGHDRMINAWNLDAMAFMENLGGHEDVITGLDSLKRESCISSGGRDSRVIVYLIVEDKQLKFTTPHSCVEGVRLINEKTFVTYGQDGSLSICTTYKKRPHYVHPHCHGDDPTSGDPRWITAVAALVYGDIVASGSYDGFIRVWKLNFDKYYLKEMFSIPVGGFVNDLKFVGGEGEGRPLWLVAAVGQEHKLGRWYCDKTVKNRLVVIPFVMKNKGNVT